MKRCCRRFLPMLLVLCFVPILLSIPVAASANPGSSLPQLIAARIYLEPDRNALPIGLIPNGQPLQVTAQLGNFLQIDCYGLTAYIHAEQVSQCSIYKHYVNCLSDSSDTLAANTLMPLEVEQLRRRILKRAYDQLGVPYLYGGQTPGGFDCSGLMEYVFHYSGFYIPRTADAQLAHGLTIDKRELLAGDLVFFNNPEKPDEFITHVGLYIGSGYFLHAGVNGGVCIRSLETGYYADHFVCARRVLNPSTYRIPSYDYFTLN